jgi:NTP pyrophosphatase (non-canonical NTP hydrolase)
MNASEYQELAARTLIDRPDFDISDPAIMLVWNAIGLAGEAGEVCEHIKKGVFHQHGIDQEKLAKELGDVLWYVAALATKAHLDMGEIMQANIDKLRLRYPNGYSSQDSQRRVDVQEEWLLRAAGWTKTPEAQP